MVRRTKEAPPYAITSVDHALRLILMLQTEGPLRVSEVATRLDVAASTAHRLLAMLVYRDFAAQRADKRYVAGTALGLVGAPSAGDGVSTLRTLALPHLEELVDHVEESVNLVVRRGTAAVFVASVECSQPLRVGNREGTTFPAHLASGGKALLAAMTDEEVAELYAAHKFEQVPGDPGLTRPDLGALTAELAGIRASGIALNKEGTERGVAALGRVVVDPDGQAVAAVSVSMPTVRFDDRSVRAVQRALTWVVRDLEADLLAHR